MAKKKKKSKSSAVKRGDRYKSKYTGRSLTIQQFIVEEIYANNKIYDITKHIGGRKYLQNQYIKNISIISKLIKKVSPEDVYDTIIKYRIKDVLDLPWRIDRIEYLNDLKASPKDMMEDTPETFDPGEDLRDFDHEKKKNKSIFQQISESENKTND